MPAINVQQQAVQFHHQFVSIYEEKPNPSPFYSAADAVATRPRSRGSLTGNTKRFTTTAATNAQEKAIRNDSSYAPVTASLLAIESII